MTLAPIVLFVYNRPEHTRLILEALANNQLSDLSELIVYSDGPKVDATDEIKHNIHVVRQIVRSKQWCKTVTVYESSENRGLAQSVVAGVTEVIEKYKKVIVLEDDIVTSSGFLKYMNEALELYQHEERVMHVSGYLPPVRNRSRSITFLRMLSCWGWGTWERAWRKFSSDTSVLIQGINNKDIIDRFNIRGHADFYEQLLQNHYGEIETWAVRWYASWFLKGGLAIHPSGSLVKNIGFDGSGVNCNTSKRYETMMMPFQKVDLKEVKENDELANKIDCYYANAPGGLWQLKETFRRILEKAIGKIAPALGVINYNREAYLSHNSFLDEAQIGYRTKLNYPYKISRSEIGDFTYVNMNSCINDTIIGKFCSIGPNFFCGWGIHPLHGISTSPMFYSTRKQNGFSFSANDKIVERKKIVIGSDVFIGVNVTILDGVKIGNGAVIGAGAVVISDVPDYAVMVGVPAKIVKYRFEEDVRSKLLLSAWWDRPSAYKLVEKYFDDPSTFLTHLLTQNDK